MRMLFSCRPGYGHVYPLLPLAAASRDAGHRVLFATGETSVPLIQRAGFEVHQVGPSIEWGMQEALRTHPELQQLPPGQGWRFGGPLFGDVLAPMVAAELLVLWNTLAPDVVVYDPTDLGAAIAAGLSGVPAVCHSLGAWMWPEPARPALTERLGQLWRVYGRAAAPVDALTGNSYLDICPPSLQNPTVSDLVNRLPMRPVAWDEPSAKLPRWVTARRSRPLVYLTLGTVVFGAVHVLRAALEGLSTLDVDVLVTVGPEGDPAALGHISERVHIEQFVAQGALLPYVDVVVHHGGSGTLFGGLSWGLPQLLLPQGSPDQFENAEALTRSGAGSWLRPDQITPDAVAEGVRLLLSESAFRNSARGLSQEIASMPLPRDVLPVLMESASKGRST